MSLLSVRRERRASGYGAARGARLWKLSAALIFVIILFWYLGRFA